MVKHNIQISFLICFLLLIILYFPCQPQTTAQGPAVQNSSTLYVGPNDTYKSIQLAIDDANPGDTVCVHSDIYYENIRISKNISLIGKGPGEIIIVGSSIGNVINITADNVTVANLTVMGSGDYDIDDAGIKLFGVNHCQILNNTLKSNPSCGILIQKSNYNKITNNEISGNLLGLTVVNSNNNIIKNNNISNNIFNCYCVSANNTSLINNSFHSLYYYGSIFDSSKCIKMVNNSMTNEGFSLNGDSIEHWNTHFIDTSNMVNGKPIYYWCNRTEGTLPSNAGQVILANCNNIIVENQEFFTVDVGISLGFSSEITIRNNQLNSNLLYGIHLFYSDKNTIYNNSIEYCMDKGIFLESSNFNSISNNIISDNQIGLHLSSADNNYILNNTIFENSLGIAFEASSGNRIKTNNIYSNNDIGILLEVSSEKNIIEMNTLTSNRWGIRVSWSSDRNRIFNNNISDNYYGIEIIGSNYNNVIKNSISKNKDIGIILSEMEKIPSTNNMIYQNNLIYNDIQAQDYIGNYWDNGYPAGGNFWGDYTGTDFFSGPGQNLTGSDGLGDKKYVLEGERNIPDNYPLMNPISNSWGLPFGTPTAPQNFKAEAGDGYVFLTWQPPAYDGGAPIQSFEIIRVSEEEYGIRINVPSNVFSYNDTNVTNGEKYYYEIWAEIYYTEGTHSSEILAKPKSTKKPDLDEDKKNEDRENIRYYLIFVFIAILLILVLAAVLSLRSLKAKKLKDAGYVTSIKEFEQKNENKPKE